jgi:hypothetical protein
MTLLAALDAFYLEHRECGRLDGDVEGDRIWMTCTGGTRAGEEGALRCRSRHLL